jgi:hypothetical protein
MSSKNTYLTTAEFKLQVAKLKVHGVEIDLEEISYLPFLTAEKTSKIAKVFKITAQELGLSGLEDSVATRLAVKDIL